jgi:predicted ester cyclase
MRATTFGGFMLLLLCLSACLHNSSSGDESVRDSALMESTYPDYALRPAPVNTAPGPEYDSSTRTFQGMPTIERTRNGRLWAAWSAGGSTEGPQNYIVLVTSTDEGGTWSSARLVIDPPGNVCAKDPTLWHDPRGRLWLFFSQSYGCWANSLGGVWAIFTENADVDRPRWSTSRRVFDGHSLLKPTVLSSGAWLWSSDIPPAGFEDADLRELNNYYRLGLSGEVLEALSRHSAKDPPGPQVYRSMNDAETWERLGAPAVPAEAGFPHERMIIERRDGSLWMLGRTRYGIGQSTSNDGGRTWSPITDSGIPHPSSKFFIRRLESGALLLVRNDPPSFEEFPEDCLNCGFLNRTHMTAFLSHDEGRSWVGGLMLDERDEVSYPDGVQAADGAIYVIYDRKRQTEQDILMARFTETDVMKGNCATEGCSLRMVINNGSNHPIKSGDFYNLDLVSMLVDGLLRQRNVTLCETLFAPDYVGHTNSATDTGSGPKSVQESLARLWATYPNATFSRNDVLVTDDAIVIRWTFTGTHRVLRREATLSGIAILHLQDGRISKGWIAYDTKSLDTQLNSQQEGTG